MRILLCRKQNQQDQNVYDILDKILDIYFLKLLEAFLQYRQSFFLSFAR